MLTPAPAMGRGTSAQPAHSRTHSPPSQRPTAARAGHEAVPSLSATRRAGALDINQDVEGAVSHSDSSRRAGRPSGCHVHTHAHPKPEVCTDAVTSASRSRTGSRSRSTSVGDVDVHVEADAMSVPLHSACRDPECVRACVCTGEASLRSGTGGDALRRSRVALTVDDCGHSSDAEAAEEGMDLVSDGEGMDGDAHEREAGGEEGHGPSDALGVLDDDVDMLDSAEPSAARFHGYACRKCGKGVGYHARRCRHCNVVVRRAPTGRHAAALASSSTVGPLTSPTPAPASRSAASSPAARTTAAAPPSQRSPLQSHAMGARRQGVSTSSPEIISIVPANVVSAPVAHVLEHKEGHTYSHALSRPRSSVRSGVAAPLSLLDSFTPEQIDAYVQALRAESMQRRFRPLLIRIMESTVNNGIFNSPVNAVELGIPDYHIIIKHPMDLGTVRQKLESGRYEMPEELCADVQLVFSNAMTYNPPGHAIHAAAAKLREEFLCEYRRMTVKSEADSKRKDGHSCGFCQGEMCKLCGDKCQRFDPPIISCDCCMERIKRSDIFYRAPSGQRWCVRCVGNNGVNAEPGAVLPPVAMASVLFRSQSRTASAGTEQLLQNIILSATNASSSQPAPTSAQPCEPVILRLARRKSSSASNPGAAAPAPAAPSAPPGAATTGRATAARSHSVSPGAADQDARQRVKAMLDGPVGAQIRAIIQSAGLNPNDIIEMAPQVAAFMQGDAAAAAASVAGCATRKRSRSSSTADAVAALKQRLVRSEMTAALRGRLEKRRNDDVVAEPWVQCDRCAGWVHQICAMFNARKNALLPCNVEYVCPLCKKADMLAARAAASDAGRNAAARSRRVSPSSPPHAPAAPIVVVPNLMPAIAAAAASAANLRTTRSAATGGPAPSVSVAQAPAPSMPAVLVAKYEGAAVMSSAAALGVASADASASAHDTRPATAPAVPDTVAPYTVMSVPTLSGGASAQIAAPSAAALASATAARVAGGDRAVERGASSEDVPTVLSASSDPFGTAATLPHTPLSQEIERRVRERTAAIAGPDVAASLVVRMVSSLRKNVTVPEEVRCVFTASTPDPSTLVSTIASSDSLTSMSVDGLAAAANATEDAGAPLLDSQGLPVRYASSYPYRQRVILLWQRLDGVDVCLFALYVQEYGPDSPPPNTNKVYIAYLDSVRYLRPLTARTAVYHEVLAAYLSNARARGFETVYIWACPPQRGDGYIFHVHPPSQRVPSKERLREWYDDMLRQLQEEGVVAGVRSLFDEFFEVVAQPPATGSLGKLSAPSADEPLRSSTGVRFNADIKPAAPPGAGDDDERLAGVKRRAPHEPASVTGSQSNSSATTLHAYPLSEPSSPSRVDKKARLAIDVPAAMSDAVHVPSIELAADPSGAPTVAARKPNAQKPKPRRPGTTMQSSAATKSKVSSAATSSVAETIRMREGVGLPPFFAGDFWAMEAERLIRDLHKRLAARASGTVRRKSGDPSVPSTAAPKVVASQPEPAAPKAQPSAVAHASTSAGGVIRSIISGIAGVFRGAAPSSSASSVATSASTEDPTADTDTQDVSCSTPSVSPPSSTVTRPISLSLNSETAIPGYILAYLNAASASAVQHASGSTSLRVGELTLPAHPVLSLAARLRELRREFIVVHLNPTRPAAGKLHGRLYAGVPAGSNTVIAASAVSADTSAPNSADDFNSLISGEDVPSDEARGSKGMTRTTSASLYTAFGMAEASRTGERSKLGHVAECSLTRLPDSCRGASDAENECSSQLDTDATSTDGGAAAVARAIADSDRQADERISCDFFDTRHGFIRMCQGNNYQFDTLRRARHSSMMILWHLHNPKIPAYAHTCNMCEHDIGAGTRWHCDTCYDYDVCDECHRRQPSAHPHPLVELRDLHDLVIMLDQPAVPALAAITPPTQVCAPSTGGSPTASPCLSTMAVRKVVPPSMSVASVRT